MEIVFKNNNVGSTKVSIVLLDWSCRESFHILDYLARQTVPRDQYEVIWIEYYERRVAQIDQALGRSRLSGKPPVVDQWVIMGTPADVYYHKHLMYNLGLVLSRGKIVTICDSDAMVSDTFVETIIRSFEEEPNLVLHLDQVRNNDKRFYPFNYPTVEEVIGEGAINWHDGKTTGLWDTEDILHTRNYGACLAARREDLIGIGGADEHIDYLGHICGPYDMTFRLINFGRKELWHPTEFLYHVWHPGQAGDNNYLGPHDGRHMSTTALEARRTGRVFPLVENPAVQALKLQGAPADSADLFPLIVSDEKLKSWSVENLEKRDPTEETKRDRQVPSTELAWPKRAASAVLLSKTFVKMLARQSYIKITKFSRRAKTLGDFWHKILRTYDFVESVCQYNLYAIRQSRKVLHELTQREINEVSVYGVGDIAEVIYDLSFEQPMKIAAIYDDRKSKRFFRVKVLPVEQCASGSEKVIIGTLIGINDKVTRLKRLGVSPERIIVLQ